MILRLLIDWTDRVEDGGCFEQPNVVGGSVVRWGRKEERLTGQFLYYLLFSTTEREHIISVCFFIIMCIQTCLFLLFLTLLINVRCISCWWLVIMRVPSNIFDLLQIKVIISIAWQDLLVSVCYYYGNYYYYHRHHHCPPRCDILVVVCVLVIYYKQYIIVSLVVPFCNSCIKFWWHFVPSWLVSCWVLNEGRKKMTVILMPYCFFLWLFLFLLHNWIPSCLLVFCERMESVLYYAKRTLVFLPFLLIYFAFVETYAHIQSIRYVEFSAIANHQAKSNLATKVARAAS